MKSKDIIIDLVQQFAYQTKLAGIPAYTTGGLSALESAFDYLKWRDPYPCPENKCDLCNEWASCGTPTPKNYTKSYMRVCGKHFSQIQRELEEEKR